MSRPDVPLPVAGAGGSSGDGGAGGAGGTTTSEPTLGASGNGGEGEPPRSDAGSAGEQALGQPDLFDELVGTDPGRNDIPGGEICERLATIQCAGQASCCAAPTSTFEDCKRTTKQGCVGEFLDAIMTDAIAGYDRGRAKIVLDEYERLARLCDVNVVAWGASTDGFRALARGTIAPGLECQPPASALFPPGAVAAAHLFACTSPETHACLPIAGDWLCVPRAAEGGTCNARKAEGAPCTFSSQCVSFACVAGACGATTRQTIYCQP
jgi:hypothetical protein